MRSVTAAGISAAFTLWFVGLVLLAGDAHAIEGPKDERALPCRPTIACTADLVPPGAFELESGVLFRKLGNDARQWTVPFLAKLTLATWAQLQVGSNGITELRARDSARGRRYFDDVTIGVKLHLVDQDDLRPSLALSATASLPVASDDDLPQTFDGLFTAYATKDVGWLHVDVNAGFNAWRLDGAPLAQEWAALALSANLPPPFGVMLESYYFSDASPIAPRDGGVLFAVTHSPRPWLLFDFGGDVGFFPSTRAYSVFVGVTMVPFVLWR